MAWPWRGNCGPQDLVVISLLSLRSFVDCQLPQALAGAIKAEEGISRRLIPTPTTKIAHDLSSRALLLCLYRPIESADAAWLSGRPRRALCAHRWRPDRLRRKSRLCELWLVDVWLGSWDQAVTSQWRDCVPRIECWGDQRLDAKLRGHCPNATIKLKLGGGIPSCLPAPTGRIIVRIDRRCITMRSDGYTPTTSYMLLGLASHRIP